MKTKNENLVVNALLISLLSMMLPMILALRVLGSASYLSILYMVGYIVQFASLSFVFSTLSIRINEKALLGLMIYSLLLLIPLLSDIIRGISINYFDTINSVIKVVNFFAFFVLIENMTISKAALLKFMRFVLAISVVACLYSLVFEFNDILSIPYTSNTNTLKIKSFFSNRNQYSAFLVIGLTANLYVYQIKKQKKNIFIFILQILCILSTFSRAALFSTVILIGLMILQERKTEKKIIILFLSIVVAIGAVLTTGIFDYFLANYIRWEDSADSSRFLLWSYAWDIVRESFFVGVGFYTGVDIAVLRGMKLTQFHNMFFDLMVDGGVLEVLFIVALFYFIYKRCSRRCADKQLVKVYRASFAAFLFYACFESVGVFALSYSDTMYSIFFVSLPLLMANIKQEKDIKATEGIANNLRIRRAKQNKR